MQSPLHSQGGDECPILSVIIPLRISTVRDDPETRINYALADPNLRDLNIEFILVDDGSDPERWEQCKTNLPKFVRTAKTDSPTGSPYNGSKARNLGVSIARGDKLLLLDIDLHVYPGFYASVLAEADKLKIGKYPNRFLMVPVIYLTEIGADDFFNTQPECRRNYSIDAYLTADTVRFEKFSSGTSVILLDRDHYRRLGGFDERFEGWGFEDHEFITRLIRLDRFFPKPPAWSVSYGNFNSIGEYFGWRSAYRLYGDWCFAKGLCLTHIPHPIESRKYLESNLALFSASLKARFIWKPKGILESEYNCLMVQNDQFELCENILPMLGEIHNPSVSPTGELQVPEHLLKGDESTFALFFDPYESLRVYKFYSQLRADGFQVVVVGRGALPNSFYFDAGGFSNESNSYHPSRWDRNLDQNERAAAAQYVAEVLGQEIECLSQRNPSSSVRKILDITPGAKLLLVLFQSDDNSHLRQASDRLVSQEVFRSEIERLGDEIDGDWCILLRESTGQIRMLGDKRIVKCESLSLLDLVQSANAVLTINSDLGLLAVMSGIPVVVRGKAWYGDDRLVTPAKNFRDVLLAIDDSIGPNFEVMLKLVHYLRLLKI